MHNRRVKCLFILATAQLLMLGQCVNAIGASSSDTTVQLKKLKQEALAELPSSAGYKSEYILWQENKNYIGSWWQGNNLIVSSLNSSINYQAVENNISRAKILFNGKNAKVNLVNQGISWGEGIAIQNAVFKASKLKLIPDVFRVGIDSKNGALSIGVNSKEDVEAVTDALRIMGVNKNLITFEFTQLKGAGGKGGNGGADSTGGLPIRLGSLVEVPTGVCSVGVFARYNGKVGIITNQHCFLGSRLNQQVYSIKPRERVGYTALLPQNYGGYGVDAIFVELTTTSYSQRLIQGRQRVYDRYQNSTLVDGQKIYSVRNSSGSADANANGGRVRVYGGNQGFNVLQGSWNTIRQRVDGIETILVCARLSVSSVTTADGDSGSPVTDMNDSIIGIFSASSEFADSNNTKEYCYIPTGEITYKLGVQLQ